MRIDYGHCLNKGINNTTKWSPERSDIDFEKFNHLNKGNKSRNSKNGKDLMNNNT